MANLKKVPFLTLKSPLDGKVNRDHKFIALELEGTEGLCRDYEYKILVASKERLTEKEFDSLLGEGITIKINWLDTKHQKGERFVHGIVYQLTEQGVGRTSLRREYWTYEIIIAPRLRQLEYVKDSRIFQSPSNTSLSIVKDVLSELGIPNFRVETHKTYERKEYVTMYEESYSNLVRRLLESSSLLWKYEFTEKDHTLVIFDDCGNLPKLDQTGLPAYDFITRFGYQSSFMPVESCQASDFDYLNPPVKFVDSVSGNVPKKVITFKYPGGFLKRSEGESDVSNFHRAMKNEAHLFQGQSTIRALEAGKRFSLESEDLKNLHQQTFYVTELSLKASRTGYNNRFTAMPAAESYVQPESRKARKTMIPGSQTAVVVGPVKTQDGKMDNKCCDSLGRVRVRFHWDYHSPQNADNTSAFVRQSFASAGKNRGYIFSPCQGDEVVINFENGGDPDKPLITGCVYNTSTRLPVRANEAPKQSIIQPSNVRKTNRITFDDKAAKENFSVNAKDDMNMTVGHNLQINVTGNLVINARSLTKVAEGNIATGNIISKIGGNTTQIAGKNISNSTGLLVSNLAGGMESNLAGAAYANAALGMVRHASGADTKSEGLAVLNSTIGNIEFKSDDSIKSKSLLVANTAKDLIENASAGDIKQKSTLAIITKSDNEKNRFKDGVKTEALIVKMKGNMAINDE